MAIIIQGAKIKNCTMSFPVSLQALKGLLEVIGEDRLWIKKIARK